MRRLTLAIEISNPSSGPRGRVERGGRTLLAGPGVALGAADRAEAYVELLREGSRHDDDLMPAIDRLFKLAGAAPRDLARVALSIGPGGYTGLRIAAATAKMLAEATGAQVIGVPTALVVAWNVAPAAAPAIVCLASKNDSAHLTLLPPVASREDWIREASAVGLAEANEIERLRPRTIVADRFLPAPFRAAAERLGALITEPILSAAAVLELASLIPPIDPLALAPIYPREAEAVKLWRERRK